MKKANKILYSLAAGVLVLFISIFPAKTQNQDIEPVVIDRCSVENSTFEPGEEITYKLYYNLDFIWVPAGEVVFKISDFGDVYRISADGKTYKSYDWVFKVRDRYESYVDKETLLPNMSVRQVQEGGYTLYDKTVLDQDNQKATIERGRSKEKIHENRDINIDNCMHDILSVIYFARNLDYNQMSKGAEVPVKIFMDKQEWPLKVKYKGKEAGKKIKGQGKFNTIKFSPEVIAGEVFEEDAEMNVWVTDDKNKIPLLIESPISVGSVKAVLKDYKGLKYDMSAALKK